MPGLDPGIHVLLSFLQDEVVDGRDKPGHDGEARMTGIHGTQFLREFHLWEPSGG